MIIGVPTEIKKEEYRVGITPSGAGELRRAGHTVLIEQGAGEGSGFPDSAYLDADADVVGREALFEKADLIVKVKEPLPSEFGLLQKGQALFTYLHLAANKDLLNLLLERHITAIGYETVEINNTLPLLAPMSEIAGRMAPIVGAFYLQRIHGGSGILAPGVPGVRPVKAVILGAGVVGSSAARICIGLGMDTVAINKGIGNLRNIDELFQGQVRTLPSTSSCIQEELGDADLIIGAALVPGGKTPVLVPRTMLGTMKKGSVVVDVSVDQGGCFETSHPTTHDAPIYLVDGIIHYTVANMPGAYPKTSTLALTNATLPFVSLLADGGIEEMIRHNSGIRSGLNTYRGEIAHKGLAASLGAAPSGLI